MQTLETTISNLIESQFPSYYREEGPVLVAFVTEYYKWLESTNQSLYYLRNFYNLKDIDTTLDSFLVYFKEKYLKNIQLTTKTNTRKLVKHAIDIYRGKGTERSIELLFQLVFGSGAQVYYPGQDIFRLSDGRWKQPMYLEVSVNENTSRFVNKQITGLSTGAKAFVEQVIRRNTLGKIVDVLYISAINGTFRTNEIIVTDDDVELNRERIRVVGSLSSVLFPAVGSGEGYKVGDLVDVFGSKGRQGQIRVTGVTGISGVSAFTLDNGGYAYTTNAEIIISEKVLRLNNVVANTQQNTSNTYFTFGETITQAKAKLEYFNLSGNTQFFVGDEIFTYHSNDDIKATGIVLESNPIDSTNGSITVIITSGDDLNDNFYGVGNTVSANIVTIDGYTDLTSTANVMAVSSNVDLVLTNTNLIFTRNEIVVASNGSANVALGTVESYIRSGLEGVLRLTSSNGIFSPLNSIVGLTSNATGVVSNVSIIVGVHDISNTFTSLENNILVGNNQNTVAVVRTISEGSGASFIIDPQLLYIETVNIGSDFLRDYLTVELNDEYGFPQLPTANLNTVIDDALSYDSYDIGKIRRLLQINGGTGYNFPPYVVIYEPVTALLQKKDMILTITGATGNFQESEFITQGSTARGFVQFANSSTLKVERLNLFDNTSFTYTTNTSTKVVGFNSGVEANVVWVEQNPTSNLLGFNAVVSSEASVSNGAIISGEVVDSGFGYVHNEQLTFGTEQNIGTAVAKVETMGKTRGFYQSKGGFLSDQKKLFDGNYYQEYSYEIRSSITLDKYEDMLRKILHVAGTKYFARFVYRSDMDSAVNTFSGVSITTSSST
jgi:hypothetical protein